MIDPKILAQVAVKPLEWNGGDCAETSIGLYTVVDNTDDEWFFTWHCYPYGDALGPFETRNAAEAAAQADYEGRIRSALAPAPAVPDDVAEPWRVMLRQAEDDLRKAHATIEAQAADMARVTDAIARIRQKGVRIEREANALRDVGASLEAKIRIKVCDELAAALNPTGD